MDEFAQTRAPDDLFEDDFTPLPVPDYPAQSADSVATPEVPSQISQNTQSKSYDSSSTPAEPHSESSIAAEQSIESKSQPLPPPRASTPVRGDRHLTGGLAKPKLTEEELSAKLAAAKLNSAKRAEAHRLAEADEADFQAREAKAQVRRREEGRARRVMDMEREQNRIRKLGAQGGREWDEGKEDATKSYDRGRGNRRGMNGGINVQRGGRARGLYEDGLPNQGWGEQDPNDFRGRGRGRGSGRGPGRGKRDSGRGGFQMSNQVSEQRPPDPEQDFPALPPSKPKSEPKTSSDRLPEAGAEGSWADQVTDAQKSGW